MEPPAFSRQHFSPYYDPIIVNPHPGNYYGGTYYPAPFYPSPPAAGNSYPGDFIVSDGTTTPETDRLYWSVSTSPAQATPETRATRCPTLEQTGKCEMGDECIYDHEWYLQMFRNILCRFGPDCVSKDAGCRHRHVLTDEERAAATEQRQETDGGSAGQAQEASKQIRKSPLVVNGTNYRGQV